jgi:hypothetical protein
VDPKTEPEDNLVDAIVGEALVDIDQFLSPEVLAAIRGCLEDRLRAHPEGRALLRRAMPDPQVDKSGDVDTDGESDDAEDAEEGTG